MSVVANRRVTHRRRLLPKSRLVARFSRGLALFWTDHGLRRTGRHMRGHCWSGKGQARAKDLFTTVWGPATACQSTCLEENARERTPPIGVHGRPSRHENWSNAQRHNRNDHWSNVPQEAARIRPRLEPETCLTQHQTVGSLRPQYSAARIHRRTEKCPGSDAGALQAEDTSLLACHSVQPGLALIMPGEDDVDLGIGRDRDHDTVGDTQAHQFGVACIADVLRHSFAQKVSFR